MLTGLVVSFIVLASLSRAAKDNVGQNIWAVNLVDVWCAVLFQQGKLDEAKAEYGRGIKIDPEMECLEYNEVLKDNDESLPELEEPLFRQKLVVFSGAGISVESGIPSYRDCRGEWVAKGPEEHATAAAFYENPQKVLDYYNRLRHTVHEAKPNHAHKMLAKLEQWHDVTIRNFIASESCIIDSKIPTSFCSEIQYQCSGFVGQTS